MSPASSVPAPLHLVLGDEELLVDRAVAGIVAAVRASSANAEELPVTRLRAGDVSVAEFAELLSPSLFAEDRVIVLEAAAEAGKDAVALVLDAAAAPPEGFVLVILHSGGGRAKAMVGALQKSGAVVHECAKLGKQGERADFVRGEFRAAGVRVSPEVIQAVIDAVGSDLRELAAACSQLAADTGGLIDAAAVQKYYTGKAEVSGFDVAELAVSGDRTGAMEALRWAMLRGVPHVLLADALADAVHTVARVGSAGRGDPFRMASELGMPPWKIKKAQGQARGWGSESIGEALGVVAQLNADVKGAAADPDYAVEFAVRRVAELYT
ncbi:DNA polymerase III, delta subunit [Rhodococcus sp. MTM3W5.2]|uniref:DNA polymerase III subunit delta n=1 Tax=Rhodococcus sp. MTM3W5.2 TaxID=1805827 RepID=UPI0009791BBA|nr:DNA polymerase III subunit delta [Rhodococcus sp. MTM3W5.2]AQA22626.1 DNA polymerase III, delta subunit [Rhodococcus sp. MTM3W5.2]